MFIRSQLKNSAKEILGRSYGISMAICLAVLIIPEIISNLMLRIRFSSQINAYEIISSVLTSLYDDPADISFLASPLVIVAMGLLLLISIVDIFFFAPLRIGKKRFFIKNVSSASVGDAMAVFGKEDYLNIVKTGFLTELLLFLWGILFVIIPYMICIILIIFLSLPPVLVYISFLGLIPYLIKYYSYYMIYYLIADDPSKTFRTCLSESKKMTHGCRFEIFKTVVSFLPLVVIGTLLCGIGAILVLPYIEQTMALIYMFLKDKYGIV